MPKREQEPDTEEGFQTPLALHLHASAPGTYRIEYTVTIQGETTETSLTRFLEHDPLFVAEEPMPLEQVGEGEISDEDDAARSYEDERFARRVLRARPNDTDMVRLIEERPGVHNISGLYHLCTGEPYAKCRQALATTIKGKPNDEGKTNRAFFDRYFRGALAALRQMPGWIVDELSGEGPSAEGTWSITGGTPAQVPWRFDKDHDCRRHGCAEHRAQLLRYIGRSQ